MRMNFFLVLMVSLFILTACKGNPLSGLFDSKETQPPGSAGLLFADDFSNTGSGWDRLRIQDGITDYENGQYIIQIDHPNYDYLANPSRSFTDVRVEVEASKASGDADNNYGIICRYLRKNDFYAGLISSDGFYGIFKVKGGEYNLLGLDAMVKSPAIKSNSDLNLIRFDCIGATLTLYVNGVQLDTRQDADFTAGDVGLLAGTYKTPGVKIAFDNFNVYQP